MLHFARLDASGEQFLWEDKEKVRKDKRSHAGQRVEVVIRRRRSQRSIDQNKYIHGVPFKLLAEAFGYDKDEMPALKLALMGECWGYQTNELTGREFPRKPHTSDMTTDECGQFIEWLIRFGAKHDVLIPLPNEVDLDSLDEDA